jgi:hypothetical protein
MELDQHLLGTSCVPFAFLLDITDARMNIGLLRTVPGSAKIVQTMSKPTR